MSDPEYVRPIADDVGPVGPSRLSRSTLEHLRVGPAHKHAEVARVIDWGSPCRWCGDRRSSDGDHAREECRCGAVGLFCGRRKATAWPRPEAPDPRSV